MTELSNTIISLDVDWAPDFMIDHVVNYLIEHKVKSTWFVTHESPALESLKEHDNLFELGIHPNFLPGSSQGTSVEDVLKYMMQLVPQALSVRTHGVVQSGQLLSDIVRLTPIKIDATIFLPEMPGIQTVQHLTPNGTLLRIPTFWADDYELLKTSPCWRPSQLDNLHGLKVYNFHPIHIYLNTPTYLHYQRFRDSKTDISNMTSSMIEPFINEGPGVRDLFLSLVQTHSGKGEMIKDFIPPHNLN